MLWFSVAVFAATGCRNDNDALDAEAEELAVAEVKAYVGVELASLTTAGSELADAAPAPDADGWSSAADAAAVSAMKAAWGRARDHYERTEGAIAVLFPDLDVSTDERYDGFIAVEPDPNLFDDQIVTGVHAIERIVWSDEIPAYVVAFESALPNYAPAAFPASQTEASDFKERLCEKLVADFTEMETRFEPLALDPAAAYEGVVGSMLEQVEKVTLAETGEEESRYAQNTAADMRANLEGGRSIYDAFSPWVRQQEGGEGADDAVYAGFDRMEGALAAIVGDAIPPVPETWNPDAPTAADLQTEYGRLWSIVQTESDPEVQDSLVASMVAAAGLLGISVAL